VTAATTTGGAHTVNKGRKLKKSWPVLNKFVYFRLIGKVLGQQCSHKLICHLVQKNKLGNKLSSKL